MPLVFDNPLLAMQVSQGCEHTAEDSEFYEEIPDEPEWHRPVDRRAYRAQLARERAAWKAAHAR